MNGQRMRPGAIGVATLASLAVGLSLLLIPTASAQGVYTDPTGDNSTAGDITGITVNGDKTSGQIIFTINGTNIVSGADHLTALAIDSDANPLTGSSGWPGAEYLFVFADDGYSFGRWTGSDWDWDTPYTTVRVHHSSGSVTVSVNRSELGNTSELNFVAEAADITNATFDDAPNDGSFNYSLDANGVDIVSVDVQTVPSAGPKAGKKFTLTPTGIHLPASGAGPATPLLPESYSCTATLKGRTFVGRGTGSCTFAIPKKKSRGKTLKVTVTVQYEGTSKAFPYSFKVT